MSDIVTTFLGIQAQFKVLHWQTKSYAQHKAYEQTYNSLDPLIDQFIEIVSGKIGRPKLGGDPIELKNLDEIEVKSYLSDMVDFLVGLDEKFEKGDTDLANIRDEMLATINTLRYLLTLE